VRIGIFFRRCSTQLRNSSPRYATRMELASEGITKRAGDMVCCVARGGGSVINAHLEDIALVVLCNSPGMTRLIAFVGQLHMHDRPSPR
jgi:hypothetical protein